jgi:hypothetical protein
MPVTYINNKRVTSMTLRIDLRKQTATPVDNIYPTRANVPIRYNDLRELPQIIQDRIALLKIAPKMNIVDGVGYNQDGNILIVAELDDTVYARHRENNPMPYGTSTTEAQFIKRYQGYERLERIFRKEGI